MTRTMFHPAVLALGIALAVAGCAPAPGTDNPMPAASASPDPELDRANAAAMAFSGQLRATLQAAMQAGGPVAAIDVCNTEAPRIAASVMAEQGVRLGRVALPARNRNPAQAADTWKLAALKTFQQAVAGGAPAAGQSFVTRDRLPAGVALRMMRGIATEPGCLACHGGDIAPGVRQAIRAHYPDDAATGFAVGDLRGALWVEVPAASAPSSTSKDAPP